MPGQGAKQSREAEVSATGTGQPERPLIFKTELNEHQQPDSADQITKAVEETQRKKTVERRENVGICGEGPQIKSCGVGEGTLKTESEVLGVKQAESTRNSSLSEHLFPGQASNEET